MKAVPEYMYNVLFVDYANQSPLNQLQILSYSSGIDFALTSIPMTGQVLSFSQNSLEKILIMVL